MSHIPDLFTPSEDVDTSYFDQKGRYVLRYDAEGNMAFQQLIPYVLIKKKDKDQYFIAKRIAGDDRLLNTLSVGFGGHIDPEDGHVNVIMNGLKRELDEELRLWNMSEPKLIGTMRDLSSSTADHTGFVYIVEVTSVKVKEKDKMVGKWIDLQDIVDQHFGKLESWSKHIIDYLYHTDI